LKVIGIAVFSGGLDSTLAVKVIGGQDIEVRGVTFETPFFNAGKARAAARRIGLPLTVIDFTLEHLEMLKAPRYGYGKNMNPCIDCHTLMLKRAGLLMEQIGADFIFTGEVLGQRPMSQGKQSLLLVARNSGYQDVVLRPLSARLLPETLPEREGKVDRGSLLALQGRGRKDQIELAKHYGITEYAAPAGGCLLTDPMFSKRLKELFAHQPDFRVRDIELLKYGRHFRLGDAVKAIVGRKHSDNEAIRRLAEDNDTQLHTADFPGPTVLIPYGGDDLACRRAASLCLLYSDAPNDREMVVTCTRNGTSNPLKAKAADPEDARRWII